MKQELDDKLVAKYPKIFATIKHTECDDGWYTIIDRLCSNIQRHTDWWKTNRVFYPEIEQVVVEQCKEKFGTLRFYYEGGDEYINGLVSMAESMSEVTCEVCGNPGTLRGDRWIKTLCDTHHQERQSLRAGNGTP
jgi:hypothetical protein